MKLLKLLFVVLLFACNDDSKDTPTTGKPKQIVVEMDAAASNVTDVWKPIKNTVFGKMENIRYY